MKNWLKENWFKISTILVSFIIAISLLSIAGNYKNTPNVSDTPENNVKKSDTIRFYIKSTLANIRECPSTDCKVVVQYHQNSWWDFPSTAHYNTVNDMPDWVYIGWSDEKGNSGNGYINKSNFSNTPIVINQNQAQQQNSSISQNSENYTNNTNKIFDFWGKSIALISCFNSGVADFSSGGSGTLFKSVEGDYIVLTNQHVISGTDLCFILFLLDPTGTGGFGNSVTFQGIFAGKLSKDPNNDEYLLKPTIVEQKWRTTSWRNDPLSLDFIEKNAIVGHICDPNTAKIGDDVTILGYPTIGSQYGLTLTSGKISGYEGNYYVTDAKIDHGNSGGAAILVKNNCYLGIPTFGIIGEVESLGRILDISRFKIY